MKKNRNLLIAATILTSFASLHADKKPREVQLPHSVSKPDVPSVAPKSLVSSVEDLQPLVKRKKPDQTDVGTSAAMSPKPKSDEKVVEIGKMEIELKPDTFAAPKKPTHLVDDVQPLVKRPKAVQAEASTPIIDVQPKTSVAPESKPLEHSQKIKEATETGTFASPKEITQAIFNKLLEQEKLKPENAKRYEEIEKLKNEGYAASTLNRQKAELDKRLESKIENSPLYGSALEQQSRLEKEALSKKDILSRAKTAETDNIKASEKVITTAPSHTKDQKLLNQKLEEIQQLLDKSKAQRLAVIEKNAGITETMRNKQKDAVEKSFLEKAEALKKQATENPKGVLDKKTSTYLKDFELKQTHDKRTQQAQSIREQNTETLRDLKNLKLDDPKQALQLKKEVAKLERASKLLEKKWELKQASPTATEASKTVWYLKEQQKLDSKLQALHDRALHEPELLGKKKSRVSKIKSMFRRK